MNLVVIEPFESYVKGQRITDPKAIEAALKEHASRVVKVAAEPEAKKSK